MFKSGDLVTLKENTKPIASLTGTYKLDKFLDFVTKNIRLFIIDNCMQICYSKFITPILIDDQGKEYRETKWCVLKTNSINWRNDLINLTEEIEIDIYVKNYHELYNHPSNLIKEGSNAGRTYMFMRQ